MGRRRSIHRGEEELARACAVAPRGTERGRFHFFKTDLRHLDLIWQELLAVALAIAFPVVLFPFSRTVWIAMDLIFHPPGRTAERQLRGALTERDVD